mgnify:CR=1 FL=1
MSRSSALKNFIKKYKHAMGIPVCVYLYAVVHVSGKAYYSRVGVSCDPLRTG